MKRILFVAICAAFSLAFWMSGSDAQMCRHMGECTQGGMMGGMGHGGMEMMHERRGGMMEGEGHIWRSLMGLNLSDQQKESLKSIKSRVMKEAIRKGADLRIAMVEQKDLLDKDPVDIKAVEAKLRQIEGLRTDIHLLFIKAMEEVKSKLTPEQKKMFMEMMEKGPMMGGMGTMHAPDCGKAGEEECQMMKGMMHHGPVEGGMPRPWEEKTK